MSIVQHLIHGELVTKGERTADVFNPSTGQCASVELASRATVQEAIDSAKAAFPAWRNTPPAKAPR
jgi:malonate-semialdehyde dehydrogenase (acetylating)/methylmalonate-semialdehyde dehydrogenase